jgi:hypothetical protein
MASRDQIDDTTASQGAAASPEIIPPNQPPDLQNVHPEDIDDLPAETPGNWRIELHYLPIADRGHAFLKLVDPSGNTVRELHGLSRSRIDGHLMPIGTDGSYLLGVQPQKNFMGGATKFISTVANGSYGDVVRGKWRSGLQAAEEMNAKNYDYKGYDPSYGLGGEGGQIQNSNSANYTFGKFMHLDLEPAIRGAGLERTLPGRGRDLLDPDYSLDRRYVAPPLFPPNNFDSLADRNRR